MVAQVQSTNESLLITKFFKVVGLVILAFLPLIIFGLGILWMRASITNSTETHALWVPADAQIFDKDSFGGGCFPQQSSSGLASGEVVIGNCVKENDLESFKALNPSKPALIFFAGPRNSDGLDVRYLARNPDGGSADFYYFDVKIAGGSFGKTISSHQVKNGEVTVQKNLDLLGNDNSNVFIFIAALISVFWPAIFLLVFSAYFRLKR